MFKYFIFVTCLFYTVFSQAFIFGNSEEKKNIKKQSEAVKCLHKLVSRHHKKVESLYYFVDFYSQVKENKKNNKQLDVLTRSCEKSLKSLDVKKYTTDFENAAVKKELIAALSVLDKGFKAEFMERVFLDIKKQLNSTVEVDELSRVYFELVYVELRCKSAQGFAGGAMTAGGALSGGVGLCISSLGSVYLKYNASGQLGGGVGGEGSVGADHSELRVFNLPNNKKLTTMSYTLFLAGTLGITAHKGYHPDYPGAGIYNGDLEAILVKLKDKILNNENDFEEDIAQALNYVESNKELGLGLGLGVGYGFFSGSNSHWFIGLPVFEEPNLILNFL